MKTIIDYEVEIIKDVDDVYEPGSIYWASDLIDDYFACLNESDPGALHKNDFDDWDLSAIVKHICNTWGISLQPTGEKREIIKDVSADEDNRTALDILNEQSFDVLEQAFYGHFKTVKYLAELFEMIPHDQLQAWFVEQFSKEFSFNEIKEIFGA